ncbi:MAG: PAS domain S-box protein, partial [Anaerolineales bacterium]|nr:PAS domain S-box protein [Anaerolineales bacterium]
MFKLKRISTGRAVLALGTWAAYVLAFTPFYRLVGPAVAALGILPVVAMGWFFGMRAGVLAGLLAFPLNMSLIALAGGAGWDTMSREGGLLGSLLIVLIGAVVGRLSDLDKRMKQELTEHKQLAEQTKQLQEYLQLRIERMPIGSITWDTEFRVKSWNPAAERIFGFTAQEALGKHPYGLIVPREAQPQVDDIWRRLLEGDTTAHNINENVTKDGRTIICQWSNTPLTKADGTVLGILSMVQDITERKRAEEALERRVSELNALNAMAAIVNESLDV